MTEVTERSIIPNDLYKTTTLSGLREGREIHFIDDGVDGLSSTDELSTNLAEQLQPGTLIELRPADSRVPVLAVIVGHINGAYYFYSEGGQLLSSNHLQVPTVLFSSPDFAPGFETQPLANYIRRSPEEYVRPDALHRHQPNQELGRPLRKRLKLFSKAATALYQKHLPDLVQAETLVPHDTEATAKSLYELIDELLPRGLAEASKKSPKFRYAVHMALLGSPSGAFRNLNRLQSPPRSRSDMYLVLSSQEVQSAYGILDQVRIISLEVCRTGGQIRENQKLPLKLRSCKPVWNFVLKARRLIMASRERRGEPKHGMLPPSVGAQPAQWDPHVAPWTKEEKEILSFLQWWMGHNADQLSDMQFVVGTSILRFTGLYKSTERLDNAACFTFLKEIGWLPSWELASRYKSQIPGVEPIPGGAEGGYRRQPCADLWQGLDVDFAAGRRKDWSSLVAFAVDSKDTAIVDDAISIEAADKPGEYWIHVHVADPTAFLKHDSALARYLATVPENLYTAGYFASMIPSDFIHDAIERWSLAKGKPCLTFSTRLTSNGEVLDSQVQPGTLGAVVYMTYDELAKVCPNFKSAPAPPGLDALSVGPSPEGTMARSACKVDRLLASVESLSREEKRDLITMYDVVGAYRKARLEEALHLLQRPQRGLALAFDVDRAPAPWPTNIPDRSTWSGDPTISVGYSPPWSDGIVSIAMKMAGEAAARWCEHRRIPIPFVTQPTTLRNSRLVAALTRKLNELTEEGVTPPPALWRSYTALSGPSVLSLEPQPVLRMGVAMYARVTSPLRRFVDCIAHWQIHAAIAYEAGRKLSLRGADSSAADFLPWTRSTLAAQLAHMSFNASCARRLSSSAGSQGWIYQAVLRAWLYEKDKLPGRFIFTVHEKFSSVLRGDINYLGLSAAIYRDNLGGTGLMADTRSGDMFEAEIRSIDAFHCQIELTPVRKLGAEEAEAELRRRHGGRDVQEIMRSVLEDANTLPAQEDNGCGVKYEAVEEKLGADATPL